MPKQMTVAVLGAGGTMGLPMARNIARAGLSVRAWNRSPEKVRPLAEDGAHIADGPRAAVEGADVVMTMLADAEAVLQVAEQAKLQQGQIWWQASTIGIDGNDRCAELAARSGAVLVDAPVLGTRQPAEEGKLVVLASGPDTALDACAPLFDAVGMRTLRLGEAGRATRLKLAVNTWVLAVTEGTAETIALAQALDLDPQLILDALDGGGLDLPYMRMKAKLIFEREFPPAFSLRLAAKDARLVVEAADRNGADLPAARAIAQRMTEAAEAGHGDEDMAAVYLLSLEPRSTEDVT